MDKSVREETIRENTDKEDVGPHDRSKRRICAAKGKSIPIVKRGKRGG